MVEPSQWRLGWSKRQEPPDNHFDHYPDDDDNDDDHLNNLLLAAELVDEHVLPVVHLRQGHVQLPIHLCDDDGDDNDDDKDNARPLSAHHLEGALPDPSLQSRSPFNFTFHIIIVPTGAFYIVDCKPWKKGRRVQGWELEPLLQLSGCLKSFHLGTVSIIAVKNKSFLFNYSTIFINIVFSFIKS